MVSLGNLSNGDTGSGQELFVRQDGATSLTNCGLFVRAYSGSYTGAKSASLDFEELLAWGDASASADFGGIQLNLNATGSYPTSAWPTVSSKSPTGGRVVRTGVGDSEANAILIPTTTGATAEGTLQAGSSPNVRFKIRIVVPTNETQTGDRLFDVLMTFSTTS